MTVEELIKSLQKYDKNLQVRVEVNDFDNYWVVSTEGHNTGDSGYEFEGEVVLNIGN